MDTYILKEKSDLVPHAGYSPLVVKNVCSSVSIQASTNGPSSGWPAALIKALLEFELARILPADATEAHKFVV